jgi:peptidyl-prolyl cis-trans isomerase C
MFKIEILNTRKLAIMAILAALAINPAFAEDKSAALVNGVSIPQSRIDHGVKGATAQGQLDTPELRKAVREDIINLEVLAQEAVKLGLDKDVEVKLQIELAQQSILVSAFLQDYAKKNPISDEVLKQEYDEMKAGAGDKQYKARHILVDSEAEAKDIITQLGKKGKFDKLATKSKDVGSAEKGGELDWAIPRNFVKPFADAMITLKKGEYTKVPVESQYGWHVIKLDDVRDLQVPPFDELKPQIQQSMQQKTIQSAITEVRAKAKIE